MAGLPGTEVGRLFLARVENPCQDFITSQSIAGDPSGIWLLYGDARFAVRKKAVNFDDPATYHLYYGDETGGPGTNLTFFPWEQGAPGRRWLGVQASDRFCDSAAFARATGLHRLVEKGVHPRRLEKRFGWNRSSLSLIPMPWRLALVGIARSRE